MNNIKLIGTMALIGAVSTLSAGAIAKQYRETGREHWPRRVCYLYYRPLSTTPLCWRIYHKRGQVPIAGDRHGAMGPSGLQTEFGPGDHGYVGGRWWVDANGDEQMDDETPIFLCPLL